MEILSHRFYTFPIPPDLLDPTAYSMLSRMHIHERTSLGEDLEEITFIAVSVFEMVRHPGFLLISIQKAICEVYTAAGSEVTVEVFTRTIGLIVPRPPEGSSISSIDIML